MAESSGNRDSIMERYRKVVQNQLGWEVELTCPACHTTAIPEYGGHRARNTMRFGNEPTIYAELRCPNCGEDMEVAAGQKLVEMFSEERMPPGNKRVFVWLGVGFVVLMLATLLPAVITGIPALYLLLLVFPLLLGPTILLLNYRVHSARLHCVCDEPRYVFMGLLGRSSCYRCSNDGNLLRLRD